MGRLACPCRPFRFAERQLHCHKRLLTTRLSGSLQLQESRGFRRKIKRLEESSEKLALELELERGRLAGLGQSSAALREHSGVLETALARREADLVQLNLQVPAPPAPRVSGPC